MKMSALCRERTWQLSAKSGHSAVVQLWGCDWGVFWSIDSSWRRTIFIGIVRGWDCILGGGKVLMLGSGLGFFYLLRKWLTLPALFPDFDFIRIITTPGKPCKTNHHKKFSETTTDTKTLWLYIIYREWALRISHFPTGFLVRNPPRVYSYFPKMDS